MRYRIIVLDDDDEVVEQSQEPVEMKHLAAEGRDVGYAAWRTILNREKRNRGNLK